MSKWDPKEYFQHSANQQRWARTALAKLRIQGDEHVLDIGCGDGKVTAELAGLVRQGRVLGLDRSPEMVDFAKRQFKDVPNLSFEIGDASALSYNQEGFDLVTSFTCLHWVKDHLAVLQGIRRSLKARGRIFLQFGGKGTEKPILEMSEPVLASPRWSSFFKDFEFPWFFYGDDVYAPWVEQSGLRPSRVELLPYEGFFTEEELKGWIRSTWIPYIQRLPEPMREEFIAQVASACFEKHVPDQGRVRLDFSRLEVEAVL